MKRKKKRIKIVDLKYKIIIVMTILVIAIALLSYSFMSDNLYITSSINNIFYYPFNGLTNDEDIIGKNMNDELQQEIASLKKLTNINNVLSDFEKINGVVISRNIAYWLDDVIVNRGQKNGVEKGMSVVVSEGLVGYVSDVYDTSSRVTLITNSSYNKTSVRVNDIYLILEYDSNNNLIINQLDNSDKIKVGDVVYTSGLTDKFPAGLTIGYISKIEDNSYGTGKKLYVDLYYDINAIRYVTFLKRQV